MQYFLIPGRIKNLSLAELKAVSRLILGDDFVINSQSSNYFFLRTEKGDHLMETVFKRLGGFIKYGVLIDLESNFLEPYLKKENLTFGISCYPFDEDFRYTDEVIETLPKKIKASLKAAGVSARYVSPEGNELSSGQISNRRILEKGFELSVFQAKDGSQQAGITIAIQDLEDFVKRDYERPRSDKTMGMLPPKLARMMVNLAEIPLGGTIWDPFCGSGTVLLEALTLGYNVLGSDISEQAIDDSEVNILWLGENYDVSELKYSVFQADVTQMEKLTHRKLRNTDINAAIFEPYMGPPQRNLLKPSKAETLLADVAAVYTELFKILEHIKQENLKVVAIVPSYKTHSGWVSLRYNTFLSKRWRILTNKNSTMDLHWSRSNSIIRRNILIAELKR